VFSWGLSLEEKRAEEAAMWARHFAALLEYCRQKGTCNIAQRKSFKCDLVGMAPDGGVYKYDEKLGKWLHNQRQAKRKNKLLADREAQLQALVDQGK